MVIVKNGDAVAPAATVTETGTPTSSYFALCSPPTVTRANWFRNQEEKMRREQAAHGLRSLAAGASRDEIGAASCSITFLDLAEHGFDVNHRCAVNRFDGPDPQAVLDNSEYGNAVQSQRIWPVW